MPGPISRNVQHSGLHSYRMRFHNMGASIWFFPPKNYSLCSLCREWSASAHIMRFYLVRNAFYAVLAFAFVWRSPKMRRKTLEADLELQSARSERLSWANKVDCVCVCESIARAFAASAVKERRLIKNSGEVGGWASRKLERGRNSKNPTISLASASHSLCAESFLGTRRSAVRNCARCSRKLVWQ